MESCERIIKYRNGVYSKALQVECNVKHCQRNWSSSSCWWKWHQNLNLEWVNDSKVQLIHLWIYWSLCAPFSCQYPTVFISIQVLQFVQLHPVMMMSSIEYFCSERKSPENIFLDFEIMNIEKLYWSITCMNHELKIPPLNQQQFLSSMQHNPNKNGHFYSDEQTIWWLSIQIDIGLYSYIFPIAFLSKSFFPTVRKVKYLETRKNKKISAETVTNFIVACNVSIL